MRVGFVVNVNGGHSDGWRTAKLQVVRSRSSSGRTLRGNGSSEQKRHIFGKKKKKKSDTLPAQPHVLHVVQSDLPYFSVTPRKRSKVCT